MFFILDIPSTYPVPLTGSGGIYETSRPKDAGGPIYIFASFPTAAIGPLGASTFGEPPGGSTETAIAEP
ncbi:MAG TPA: hypothetical protein VIE16_03150, partial [Phenylobacterium sp.]